MIFITTQKKSGFTATLIADKVFPGKIYNYIPVINSFYRENLLLIYSHSISLLLKGGVQLNKAIKVIKTSRGGKITYHGPGQKVVYFVLNLNERGKDIRKLIRYIEKCIIQILKEYKIKSFNDNQNIGIWVNVNSKAKKVAAIGIRVKRWIAFHGFSINISNNLEVYKNIVPCGIYNNGITNLCSIKKNNYKYINQKIINNFLRIFK